MKLLKLKQKFATMAYGPLGTGEPAILDAGELVMPCGGERNGRVDAMSIAGLISVPVALLEPDSPRPASPAGLARDARNGEVP